MQDSQQEREEVQRSLALMAVKPVVSGERVNYGLRACARSVAKRVSGTIVPIVLYYDHDEPPTSNYFKYAEPFERMVGRALVTGIHIERPAVISVTQAGDEFFVWAAHRGEEQYTLLWKALQPPTWIKRNRRRK